MVPDRNEPWVVKIAAGTLTMPYKEAGAGGWKERTYTITFGETKTHKTIDFVTPNAPVGRGVSDLVAPGACAKCHTDLHAPRKLPPPTAADVCDPGLKTTKLKLLLALSENDEYPKAFRGKGVIVFELVPLEAPAAAKKDETAELVEQLKKLREAREALTKKIERAPRRARSSRNSRRRFSWRRCNSPSPRSRRTARTKISGERKRPSRRPKTRCTR